MKPKKPTEKSTDAADLRRRAQARLQSQTPPPKVRGSTEELQRFVQELQVHQIELEMQNEELREARARLEASVALYTDFYDFAPVGYFTLELKGEITRTNLPGARLFGHDRAALLGRRFAEFISEADRHAFNLHLQQVFAGQLQQTCDVGIGCNGEPGRFAHLETTLGPDGQECRIVAMDITQQRRDHEALRAETIRRRSLFEQSPDGIVIIDPQTARFVEFNTAAHRQLGYSRQEFARLSISDLEARETQEGIKARIANVIQKGRLDFETLQRTREGEVRNVHVRDQVVNVDGQQLFQSNWRDITEHKRAEEALERYACANELLHNSIVALNGCPDLDSALDCLLQKVLQLGDMDCGVIHFIEGQDAVLRHHLGLRSEFIDQLARRPLNTGYLKAALQNPDEMVNLITQFPEQARLGQSHGLRHIYCIVLCAEQQPFAFLTVASYHAEPPSAAKTALIRILTLETQFIFMRLRFEDRWRSILTSMSEGVVLQMAEGTIIDCNLSAEKILGLGRGQIMGWKAVREDGGAFLDEDYPAMVSLRTGQPCRDVIMGIDQPDGTQRWINVNAEPMFRGGETRPYAIVTSFADVTVRKQLEEHVRQAQKMEAIGHLTGGMAHEFNNILAAMMMSLELVQTLSLGAEARELLGGTLGSCQRAADLIKQLLAFSRQSVMRRQPMDLAAMVSKQCRDLDRLVGERITLEFSSADKLPWVNADRGMMEQVLVNLCLNARDAMKEGGLLQVRLTEAEVGAEQAKAHEKQPGRHVCLSVTDNGCGIDDQTMQMLFEPFFTTKDVGQGTGMGLATVRGMVQQHGGWVEVESCVGKGSTFQVYLPAVAQPPAAPAVPRMEKLARGQGTILVVEDEPEVRRLARMILVKTGYKVFEASDGPEALGLWREHRAEIDLVYTDMVMPGGLSGIDLAQRVLGDKPGVKVIITSGYNTEMPDLSKATDFSLVYLPKPSPAATLLSLIQRCLQRKPAGRE